MTNTPNVPAHEQAETLHIVASVPEHYPREDNPYHHLFEQAKGRVKRQGLWKCVLDDDYCGGVPELHHSHIEDSQITGSDIEKVNKLLGLHLADDAEFEAWCQGPGNLEVLCSVHHRTAFGIHVIPGPLWEPMRCRKAGLAPPARFFSAPEWAKRNGAKGAA